MKARIYNFFVWLSEKLQQVDVPMTIFGLIGLRILLFDASWTMATAFLTSAALYGFHMYMGNKDDLWKKGVEKTLKLLDDAVVSLKTRSSFKENPPVPQKPARRF